MLQLQAMYVHNTVIVSSREKSVVYFDTLNLKHASKPVKKELFPAYHSIVLVSIPPLTIQI